MKDASTDVDIPGGWVMRGGVRTRGCKWNFFHFLLSHQPITRRTNPFPRHANAFPFSNFNSTESSASDQENTWVPFIWIANFPATIIMTPWKALCMHESLLNRAGKSCSRLKHAVKDLGMVGLCHYTIIILHRGLQQPKKPFFCLSGRKGGEGGIGLARRLLVDFHRYLHRCLR